MSEGVVPEIRFDGFHDEWAEREVGCLGTFFKGSGYSKGDVGTGSTPLFLYGRLYTKYELAVQKVDTLAMLKPNSVISHGGEVLVPGSGETPEDIAVASALLQAGVIIGGDLNVIRPNAQTDPTWLAVTLSHGHAKSDLSRRAQGKSVVHLHNTDLRQLLIRQPPLAEQQAIGSLFAELDASMEQHRRKHQQLKQTKQALMQRMLPAPGETVPRVRFGGFEHEWSEHHLRELGVARTGFGFPHAAQGGRTGVPFFKVSDMNLPENASTMRVANNYVTADQVARHGWQAIVELPAILFAKVGAAVFLGRKRTVHVPFLIDNNMMAFCVDGQRWDATFARVVFDALDLSQLVQVGALPSFNPPQLHDMMVAVPPTIAEQQAIGAFFAKLDTLIAAEQYRVQKFQQVKSALLQKMFV